MGAPNRLPADPRPISRADIYAFGVMAYEMLGGPRTVRWAKRRRPCWPRTPTELPASILPLLRRDSGARLSNLVMRCLQSVPRDRPAERRPRSCRHSTRCHRRAARQPSTRRVASERRRRHRVNGPVRRARLSLSQPVVLCLIVDAVLGQQSVATAPRCDDANRDSFHRRVALRQYERRYHVRLISKTASRIMCATH